MTQEDYGVLKRWDRTTFEGHEGTLFTAIKTGQAGSVDLELEPVDLELTGVIDHSNDQVDAFSCLFRGPKEQEMGQATYRLRHETLGEMELFLVPVLYLDSKDDRICYQSVFSRPKT